MITITANTRCRNIEVLFGILLGFSQVNLQKSANMMYVNNKMVPSNLNCKFVIRRQSWTAKADMGTWKGSLASLPI